MKLLFQKILSGLFIVIFFHSAGLAQSIDIVESQRIDNTFMAPRSINLYTIESLPKGRLHVSIMQTFAEMSLGATSLWGLDHGANIRLNLEFGITKSISIGISRSSLDKVFELTGRAAIIRQKTSFKSPVSVSVIPSIGINTTDYGYLTNDYTLSDKLVYSISVPIARKITDELSFQIIPMVAHFNRVGAELNIADPDRNTYYSVGLASSYKFTSSTAFSLQFIPELTNAENIRPYGAFGFDYKRGGQILQLFFTTSTALNEPYLLAGENGKILDYDFRIGFNITRSF